MPPKPTSRIPGKSCYIFYWQGFRIPTAPPGPWGASPAHGSGGRDCRGAAAQGAAPSHPPTFCPHPAHTLSEMLFAPFLFLRSLSCAYEEFLACFPPSPLCREGPLPPPVTPKRTERLSTDRGPASEHFFSGRCLPHTALLSIVGSLDPRPMATSLLQAVGLRLVAFFRTLIPPLPCMLTMVFFCVKKIQ